MVGQKIYLDTSVISGLFAEDAPWQKESSEELFAEIAYGKYQGVVSAVVTGEIKDTKDASKQQQLLKVLDQYNLEILPLSEETDILAEAYCRAGIIPLKHRTDALHIAIAVVNGIELLLSWDFTHIVKYEIEEAINQINQKLGYPSIRLRSPQEV